MLVRTCSRQEHQCTILSFFNMSLQEGVLSPVQDGDNKPQIDANKANNYKIVKEVKSESFSVQSSYFL